MFTEAVEEMESELEVMLSLEGLIGDLLRSRSSELELSLERAFVFVPCSPPRTVFDRV